MSYEWIDDDYVYISDLEKLLNKIKRVLKDPEQAEKILPYPKDLKLSRPRKGTYKETRRGYVIDKNNDTDIYYDYIISVG